MLLRDLRFESLLQVVEAKNLELWQLKQSGSGRQQRKMLDKVKTTLLSTFQKRRSSMNAKSKPKAKKRSSMNAKSKPKAKKRSSMNAKSKPKAKKRSEDDNGETETWWKD
ncbi:hypothetical protein PRNP1_010309 [Phytophthora ramorum]